MLRSFRDVHFLHQRRTGRVSRLLQSTQGVHLGWEFGRIRELSRTTVSFLTWASIVCVRVIKRGAVAEMKYPQQLARPKVNFVPIFFKGDFAPNLLASTTLSSRRNIQWAVLKATICVCRCPWHWTKGGKEEKRHSFLYSDEIIFTSTHLVMPCCAIHIVNATACIVRSAWRNSDAHERINYSSSTLQKS